MSGSGLAGHGTLATNWSGLRPMRRAIGPAGFNEVPATNILLQSADASNAVWLKGSATLPVPTVTGNATIAPDGTLTAARVVIPPVTTVATASFIYQSLTVAAAVYTFSVYLRGNVGGEQVYMAYGSVISGPMLTLTTTWQRYTLTTNTLTTGPIGFEVGGDQRIGGQSNISGGTIYVWGGQVELGGVATSYIPTGAAPVARDGWAMRPPSQSNIPQIASTTTFIAAGVQGYGRDPDNACFLIECRTGPAGVASGGSGTVVVALSGNVLGPGGFFAAASWASITLTGSAAALSLNWIATEALRANASYVLQVEWLNST